MSESVPEFDLYATLKVASDAPAAVIVAAHRALVRRAHPDRALEAGASERTKRLNIARDWLTDPDRRRRYDLARGLGPDDASHEAVIAADSVSPAPRVDRWERSSGRARLEVFVERCGRLAPDELERMVELYTQLNTATGRFDVIAERMVTLCHRLGRDRIAMRAATEATMRAQVNRRHLAAPRPDILRWTAFALAVADVAAVETRLVLTPWQTVTDATSERPRVSWRLPVLVMLVAGVSFVVALGSTSVPDGAVGALALGAAAVVCILALLALRRRSVAHRRPRVP